MLKNTLLRYNKPTIVLKRSEDTETPIAIKSQTQLLGKPMTDLTTSRIDQSIQDVLNCIFPPMEWEDNGKHWIQTVSSEPVTQKNVDDLEEELDAALRNQEARDTGICPVRRKLFDQCFDELLRQEAINCCERGLLLKMIRDNLRMEIDTLERLYISSIAYGLRKTLLGEEEKMENIEYINTLKEKKTALEKEVKEIELKTELFEMQEAEKRTAAEDEHKREVELLKQENSSLREQLVKVIYPKKASTNKTK